MAVPTATQANEVRRATQRAGVTALVLAAGLSSRMGRPKPLLRLAGKPLLVHVLDALRASDVRETIVVLGAEAERVRREIPLEGIRVVLNADFAEGMSASIRAGLQAVSPHADGLLIVLGDQPLVTPATINALVARQEATGAPILVPTYAGVRGNPVLIHRSLSPEVEAITGDMGCRGVVAGHAAEVLEVAVDDPGILVDVDTPEEFDRVEASLREGTPLARLVEDRVREASASPRPSSRRSVRVRTDIDVLAHELSARGERFAVATVVRVVQPTSGKPGDKAIIRESGEIVGFVGGSCTGTSVVTEGLKAIREGRPRLLRLTPAVGLEPAADGVVEYAMECLSGGILDIYIEPRGPKPTLLLVGPSPIAEALTALGAVMDYRVVVAAPRAGPGTYADAERVVRDLDGLSDLVNAETFAVVATMGRYDETALRALAPSPAAYVGLVASRRRAAGVLAALRKAGVPESAVARIHSPAGLDVSAKTAEEIALSILAEIVRVRRSGTPSEAPSLEPGAPAGPRRAMDVVCGMEVDTDTPLTTLHQGATYYFCSETCRARFLGSPASFVR